MKAPLSVLLLEDNPSDCELLIIELQRDYQLIWERVSTKKEFEVSLSQKIWDVILADYELPAFDALAALEIVQKQKKDMPFIIVSGAIDDFTAVAAMKAGAHDYILKSNLTRLAPAIQREVQDYKEREAKRTIETALFTSEAKFQALWDSNVIGMIVASGNGEIIETNDSFLRMTGYQRQDINDSPLRWDQLTPFQWVHVDNNAAKEFCETGNCTPYEKQFIGKDGSLVDVQIAFAPLDLKRRDIFIACIVDITERRKKIEAERASFRKNQFLCNMSHELRSPLHNIVTASNMGIEGVLGSVTAKQNEIYRLVKMNAEHLLEIINEILDISSIEAGKDILNSRYFNLACMIEETLLLVRPLMEQKKQLLYVNLSADLPINIFGDPLRLKQALGNLLSNAHKYTPSEKKIYLTASVTQSTDLIISVKDEGPGIQTVDLDGIWKPFERDVSLSKSVPGTGLGLPISKKIIELHHGRLEFHTVIGKGTEFTIILPLIFPVSTY